MALKRIPVPTDVLLREDGKVIRLIWQDGSQTELTSFDLRAACPCAQCIDEMTGAKILKRENVSKDVAAAACGRVGRYALQFEWSDGHSAGIFHFPHLRELCPKT